MSGALGEMVLPGQANGPDVEWVVTGSDLYINFETVTDLPANHDARLGLFCYARMIDVRYASTGMPVMAAPQVGLQPHTKDGDHPRAERIRHREADMARCAATLRD